VSIFRRTSDTGGTTAIPPSHVEAWVSRVPVLAAGLGSPSPAIAPWSEESFQRVLGELVDVRSHPQVWLAITVLTGRFPEVATVVETAREAEFDPGRLARTIAEETTDDSARWAVRIESDKVVIDVAHTASTTLMTGIQRVVRETARRWIAAHDVVPVSWSQDFDAMRDLTPVELDRIMRAEAAHEDLPSTSEPSVVVPWRTRYVVPELAAEEERTGRLRALALYSECPLSAIGYDLIPITSGDTTSPGMSDAFARNLAALRHGERLAAISGAAATEYEGWRTMLGATGLDGPEIVPVVLPVEAVDSSVQELDTARERFVVGAWPMLLVVGSHEPRKNHLTVLRAAEMLWREGLKFSLTFIGGNSWNSEGFQHLLRELRAAGRPVEAASKIPDHLLWAAYRLARFTVFPSLNEGYGLPVAESLAVGTPAITSNFGSMAEIAAGGGALTVDPHDNRALATAMRVLLQDDARLAELRAEALARPQRTWDAYAADLWDFLVEGRRPAA
jgi:glycosyltransferase involved in cell wall biosynthesis